MAALASLAMGAEVLWRLVQRETPWRLRTVKKRGGYLSIRNYGESSRLTSQLDVQSALIEVQFQ